MTVARAGTVVAATKRELGELPDDLASSSLAMTALALARELDNPKNRATAKSMVAKARNDTMRELQALAPPAQERDDVDDIAARRTLRLAARA